MSNIERKLAELVNICSDDIQLTRAKRYIVKASENELINYEGLVFLTKLAEHKEKDLAEQGVIFESKMSELKIELEIV